MSLTSAVTPHHLHRPLLAAPHGMRAGYLLMGVGLFESRPSGRGLETF